MHHLVFPFFFLIQELSLKQEKLVSESNKRRTALEHEITQTLTTQVFIHYQQLLLWSSSKDQNLPNLRSFTP